MNRNAEVIFLLCSHLTDDDDYNPFTPREWSELAEKLQQAKLQPADMTELADAGYQELGIDSNQMQRMRKLLQRGASMAFELEKYEAMGISVVTRADALYPKALKSRLGNSCPPLFYYAGNLNLAAERGIGFAGSRNADGQDKRFTDTIATRAIELDYSIISGGARGVDTYATDCALDNGGSAVIYLADSMVRRSRNSRVISGIQDGRLLMLSAIRPDLPFSACNAMTRNRYIYANAMGTVVVRADELKGGTWTGASECLKHKLNPVICWNNPDYKGNQELIRRGAIPIDEDWDCDMSAVIPDDGPPARQLSFLSELQ